MGVDLSAIGVLTLAEVEALRAGKPIAKGPTRVERAVERKQEQRADETKLAAWSKAVKDRDEWKDRKTGKPVKRTRLVLDPQSAHAHHIEPRENEDVRYDVRNGITLSAVTHDAVERNKLQIIGTKFFKVNGRRYIDASHPVRWKEIA